ncbi:MAG: 30S ribosomal protein S2 [Gammaproteobacteria bacterium]|nr:MAG: 30S ribosomal protein S2 [Gammaproteobacteria bacterium]
MPNVSMQQMLQAGVHYGHQTRYWSPKMAPFLYGKHNKIHIFNLDHTKILFEDALNFIGNIVSSNGSVMLVGTKRAACETISKAAIDCKMPYVSNRWLGGMMTNFKTIKQSIKRLKDLETMFSIGGDKKFNKKEALMLQREQKRLEKDLGGIKNMERLPDALFVIDIGHEKNAVAEAVKLKIPVIAVVDSNHAPDNIDYIIPGNDDATRAIEFYTKNIVEAIADAKVIVAATNAKKKMDDKKPATPKKNVKKETDDKKPKTSTIETKKESSNKKDNTIVEKDAKKPIKKETQTKTSVSDKNSDKETTTKKEATAKEDKK